MERQGPWLELRDAVLALENFDHALHLFWLVIQYAKTHNPHFSDLVQVYSRAWGLPMLPGLRQMAVNAAQSRIDGSAKGTRKQAETAWKHWVNNLAVAHYLESGNMSVKDAAERVSKDGEYTAETIKQMWGRLPDSRQAVLRSLYSDTETREGKINLLIGSFPPPTLH
jgi:hypothetical protein